jgi:transposase-like protein
MARRCSVCDHPRRAAIDRALVTNDVGYRTVAGRFGISGSALFRHRNTHLPVTLARGLESKQEGADFGAPPVPAHAVELAQHRRELEARSERQAIDVMQQLRAINVACLEVLSKARAAEKHSTLLGAVDRIHRQIELQARLLGELQEGSTVNVLVAPEWHQVRLVVVQALHPYPEARAAVAQALAALPAAAGGDHAR